MQVEHEIICEMLHFPKKVESWSLVVQGNQDVREYLYLYNGYAIRRPIIYDYPIIQLDQ